jgi:hypothetical protein
MRRHEALGAQVRHALERRAAERKDEGGRMKDEREAFEVLTSSLHPSAFILPPSLVTERDERVYARGASRGDVAGKE